MSRQRRLQRQRRHAQEQYVAQLQASPSPVQPSHLRSTPTPSPAAVPPPPSPAIPEPPPADAHPTFYTLQEIADLFRVSRSTVDRLSAAGRLPGKFKIGGQVRYHRETVDKWILDNVRKRQG